jgi:small subunit ribosomal protein S6
MLIFLSPWGQRNISAITATVVNTRVSATDYANWFSYRLVFPSENWTIKQARLEVPTVFWYNRAVNGISFLLCDGDHCAPSVVCSQGISHRKGGVIVRVREYELMYIIDPTTGGDEEYASIVDRVNNFITNAGGTITDENVPGPTGRRKLAYEIRHNGKDLTEGFYVLLHFSAQPQQLAALERNLKLTEEIVRYLITVVPTSAVRESETA